MASKRYKDEVGDWWVEWVEETDTGYSTERRNISEDFRDGMVNYRCCLEELFWFFEEKDKDYVEVPPGTLLSRCSLTGKYGVWIDGRVET